METVELFGRTVKLHERLACDLLSWIEIQKEINLDESKSTLQKAVDLGLICLEQSLSRNKHKIFIWRNRQYKIKYLGSHLTAREILIYSQMVYDLEGLEFGESEKKKTDQSAAPLSGE